MNSRAQALGVGSLLAVLVAGAILISGPAAGADWLFFRGARVAPPPSPLGAYVHDWQGAQAMAADADHFVIYRHEWFQGGITLGPYGQYHVQQISKRLNSVPFPILIQIDLNDKLNGARRLVIINHLMACGIADAESRVVIGYPQAEGLYGDEAARIFNQNYSSGSGGGLGGSGGAAGSNTGGGLPAGGGLGTSFGSGFGGGFRGY